MKEYGYERVINLCYRVSTLYCNITVETHTHKNMHTHIQKHITTRLLDNEIVFNDLVNIVEIFLSSSKAK